MIKLLELTKRQTLTLSAITVALGIAFVIGLGVFVAAQGQITQQAFGAQPSSSQAQTVSEQPVTDVERTSDGRTVEHSGTQTVTTYGAPQAATTQPAPKQQNSEPLQPTPTTDPISGVVQGVTDTVRGVTYTLKAVVPGDPLSYVGTYGQCPFYEDASVKGCWPPKDIECNANWSVCTYKGN